MGVHVECRCSPPPPPQNSSIFHDNYEEVQPRGRRISKRIVHQRLRLSHLRGPGFILRRLLCHTMCPTRRTSRQLFLKARKLSNNNNRKRKRALVARSCICLCGAQASCQCLNEVQQRAYINREDRNHSVTQYHSKMTIDQEDPARPADSSADRRP
ncbi:hypothetical protein SO802_013432 [Lithocarpus litseifolius]|uniref:Uncharacterized protein n=1 Tax=Lithocarpus litseifolius TaxID=425828 RepID=A0AAW2DB30_9ROSI